MKTITHTYTGVTLNELCKKYGTGKTGFYSNGPWWKDEDFAKERAEMGTYTIKVDKQLENMTFADQQATLTKDEVVLHPAIITEAILEHFTKTGERLLENWYTRTSSLGSDGNRVLVGDFGAGGLDVGGWRGDRRSGGIGLSAARKLPLNPESLEPIESLNLESAIKICKEAGLTVTKTF